MSQALKTILLDANASIAEGDYEGFLAHCTEDTRWNFLGDRVLEGKEAVRRYMAEVYKEPPVFEVTDLIAEGELLTAIGRITLKDDDGTPVDYTYCDVWRFRGDKMAELRAFVVKD